MKLQLVDDWKRSWRWASVRLSWVWGLAVGFLIASPDVLEQFKQLIVYVPEQWRPLASFGGAVLASLIPWLARVTKKVPGNAGA